MRFDELGQENIFNIDVEPLSPPNKAKVYFERAKIVVEHALRDPVERRLAVRGVKFSRAYLCSKVGCGSAVTTQNPEVKRLLRQTDHQLAQEAGVQTHDRPSPGGRTEEEKALRQQLNATLRQLELANVENADLRRKLKEAGYRDTVLTDHGILPW